MDEYIIETSEALTEVLGEDGVSFKIVDDICDCLALDAIERIRATEVSASIVCQEVRLHLKYVNVCSHGLARLVKILKASMYEARPVCQEILAADGLEIILTCMSTHVESADIQGNGCFVLRELIYCSTDRELDNVLLATLTSRRGVRTFLAALEQHPGSPRVHAEAFSAMCQLDYILDASASEVFFSSLVEGGAIPLVFSSLQCNAEASYTVTCALNVLQRFGYSSQQNIQRAFQSYKQDHWDCRHIVEHVVNMHTSHVVVNMVSSTILPMLGEIAEDED